jgi:uncharacterized membrane protein
LNQAFAQALRSAERNILAGLITIAPLFVTYLIFSFVLGILAKIGLPIIELLAAIFPGAGFAQPWLQFILAILLTLAVLYAVGRVTSEFAGKQVFAFFEASLQRLPVVAKIYGSVRQLIDNMTGKHETGQLVVLVDFPIAGQKCIGFLNRTMVDSVTGETVAAVLLPNAINPTSALLQLVPLSQVTETDMSMEQAMSMLLTGGAVGPEVLRFAKPGSLARGAGIVAVSVETTEVNVVLPGQPGPAPCERPGKDEAHSAQEPPPSPREEQ